jgi:tRNA pseudouridine38-40 synthase
MTQRIALGVEYDGSGFNGWQMQAHGTRTVQAELQRALSQIADHAVQVTCAGRTDTGVHATGQVVHFDIEKERDLSAWIMGANTLLPSDVSVHWAQPVDTEFSARFSAVMRSYRYVILNRRARSALQNRRVSWIYDDLNLDAMQQSVHALLGENDFSAFRSAACQATHARRKIESIKLCREHDYIYIDIRANAFLHHMVRNIVGSMLMIGRGEQPETWLADLLAGKDRTQAGPTAAADGLYLVNVEYPEHYGLPHSGYLPRFG